MSKHLYIIAGCNGAGKTTASFTILPEILACKEFVNADEIAKGLSPFQPEAVSFEAGRIMLHRISELLLDGRNFAFETTLATRIYQNKIFAAKKLDYKVTMLFFSLNSVALAKERVKMRVQEGGHNIDADVIERRFKKGIQYLFELYIPIVDELMIFDNSEGRHELIAEKIINCALDIINISKFTVLKELFDEKNNDNRKQR
jgi:predicted ABC-type ATPase